METGRNYESILITIISNITVLVSHNVICFGYFFLRVMVSVRRLLQMSPLPLFLTKFSPGLLLQKIMHFQSKTNFSFNLCWSVLILLFCVCIFLRAYFPSFSIMKLRISNLCIASYLVSHKIMWHNKRIHGHGLKITNCCCFFSFRSWYYLHDFKILTSFREWK